MTIPTFTPVVLTIGGSDPSGGAGIQADLKTFHQFQVYGASAITLLTVQNTVGVTRVFPLPPDLVRQQIEAVIDDLRPAVIKTGALGSAELIQTVAEVLRSHPKISVIADPVMISKHGHPLMDASAIEAFQAHLLPLAFVVTPNVHEAERLSGLTIDNLESAVKAGHRLLDFGSQNIFLKTRLGRKALDLLIDRQAAKQLSTEIVFSNADMESSQLQINPTELGIHGSGCVLSAALAASLASDPSRNLENAAERAKHYTYNAVRHAYRVGQGIYPANTLYRSNLP